jgi:hypothetical protein
MRCPHTVQWLKNKLAEQKALLEADKLKSLQLIEAIKEAHRSLEQEGKMGEKE